MMSAEPPTPTQAFFRGWQLYQAVIQHNYMAHREIVARLANFTKSRDRAGMSILDLGCGDAYTARTAWGEQIHAARYTGVDLSGPALQFAREAFVEMDWTINLIEGEISTTLAELEGPVDLILAGHSLHHLDEPAKQQALVHMKEILHPRGSLLLYDLLPRLSEPRDAYIQRLLSDNESDWTLFTAEQLRAIRDHVENFDFPIQLATWRKYAAAAGFASSELLFRDAKDHYGLIHFSP